MTPSEPTLPPPPAPPSPWDLPAPPLSPLRPPVPIDEPRRTSPRTVALEAIALVWLGVNAILGILLGEGIDGIGIWLGLAFVGYRLVGWWFRTYTVTAGELVLEEGILQKRHRAVPFSRVQQVELRQQILARILGVSLVQVETAGDAGSTAVVLRFLEHPQAEALRDHLLAQQRRVRGGRVEAPTATSQADVWHAGTDRVALVRLRPAQLVSAALTSGGTVTAATLTILATTTLTILRATTEDTTVPVLLGQWGALTVGLLVVIGIVATAFSCAHSWDYELAAIGDDLHVQYGLLDRRQHTIPRHRLQHVLVLDNPVRRSLGLVAVQLHSAATPGRGDSQGGHIEIPVIADERVDDLLEHAMGDARWRRPELRPRPPAAKRRAIVRRTAATATIAIIGAAAWWPAGAALLPLAALGVPWGLTAHRRAGWAIDGSVLAFASGALRHHLELIPRERVQSVRTRASVWQRRVCLHTLRIDVAGGRQHVRGAAGLMDLEEHTPVQPVSITRPAR